jgi:hypothetical protein
VRWVVLPGQGYGGGFGRTLSGAASARFDRRAGEVSPVDLAARRDRPRDDLNAERWLDEGGSFTREAVARWPNHR